MTRISKTDEFDVFLIFRWLVLLSIILIAAYTTNEIAKIDIIYKIAFSYFAINLGLRILKPDFLKKNPVLFLVFLLDIIVVSIVFYLTKGITSDYYIFYFLTIMMASISSGIGASLAITVTSVGIYLWLVTRNQSITFNNPVLLLKVVFLLLTAFISSIWNNIMKRRIEDLRMKEDREKEQLKKFYQIIINSLNSGIAVFDDFGENTVLHLINPKARDLSKNNHYLFNLLNENLKKNDNSTEKHELIRSEDGKYWGLNWADFKHLDGSKRGRIAIFNDVTDRIKMQKEMERTKRINHLGKLTLQIAHDLRNPLGTVHGLAQMIKYNNKDNRENEYANKILKATDKINLLIEDMLEFSRESKLEMEKFNISTLIEEIIDEFEKNTEIDKKNVSINLEDGNNIKPIDADKDKLWRVFSNLIKNAYEAVNGKGIINIRVIENDDKIKITVQDNGSGIPESKIDDIFEPFMTTKSNGTGLGLSIVHQIITIHKGKISVDSKEGQGTKFTVELPKKGGKNG